MYLDLIFIFDLMLNLRILFKAMIKDYTLPHDFLETVIENDSSLEKSSTH